MTTEKNLFFDKNTIEWFPNPIDGEALLNDLKAVFDKYNIKNVEGGNIGYKEEKFGIAGAYLSSKK